MHASAGLSFQEAEIEAFDRTRHMTDGQCRRAEVALVTASLETLEGVDRKDDIAREVESRPDRAFRYLVLETFQAASHAMEAAGEPSDAYEQAVLAYLDGDPTGLVEYVTPEHLARYLGGTSH